MKRLIVILLPTLLAIAQVSSRARVGSKVSVSINGPASGSISITTIGVSSTQAVLSYTAPSTSACTVEVSQNSGYNNPLVNDVDSGKFAGASSDSRDGNLGAGTTSRLVVIGKRTSAQAADTLYYSRALQAYTAHYARVTCGAAFGTVSFTTGNIPGGMTYADYPAPSTPGVWNLPTFVQDDRSQTQIDQYTGAYYRALTIWSDRSGDSSRQGFNMAFGGFVRPCSAGLQTSTVDGSVYVCQFFVEGPEVTVFYAIRPSDGHVTRLGHTDPDFGHVQMDPNMCFVGTHGNPGDLPYRYCYAGDWTEQYQFVRDNGTLYSSVSSASQVNAFDATFDSSLFGCPNIWASKNSTQQFSCGRGGGGQDNYGWIIAYWGGDGRVYGSGSCGTVTYGGVCPGVVGAFNPMAHGDVRFQANHNFQPLQNVGTNPTVPIMAMNWQTLNDNSHVGTGKWSTTLTNSINDTQTSVQFDTCPTSESGDTFNPGCWVVGGFADAVDLGPGGSGREEEQVTSCTGSGPYTCTITRTSSNRAAQTAGQNARMIGNATNFSGCNSSWMLTYWLYGSDPHGTALVRDHCFDPGGHYDDGLDGRLSEGFVVVPGDISTQLDIPIPLRIDNSPKFHNMSAYCFGSICNMHPTYHQTTDTPVGIERNHFSDGMTWNGGYEQFGQCSGFSCTNATNITGTLYKYRGADQNPYAASYTADHTSLYRKVFPTVAISGSYAYVDVSGPTSSIGGTSGDNGKYCVAYAANECRSGSTAGDIYFNPPYTLDYLYCTGADGPVPNRKDICIASYPAYGRATVPQFYIPATSTTNATRRSRVLGGGVRGVRELVTFSFSKILPDASWYMMPTGFECTAETESYFCNIWLAKSMPFPAQDAYDRSDFIATTVSIGSVPATTTNVIVRFGYTEFGLQTDFRCTTRAEKCVVNSATIPAGADPFSYATDGTGAVETGLAGVACTSTCTVALPGLSQHILYYQVVYRNSSNATVQTDATQVAVIP